MRKAQFEVYQQHNYMTDALEWRWRLRAANGRIICWGESHPTRYNALRAVRGVMRLAPNAVLVEVEK